MPYIIVITLIKMHAIEVLQKQLHVLLPLVVWVQDSLDIYDRVLQSIEQSRSILQGRADSVFTVALSLHATLSLIRVDLSELLSALALEVIVFVDETQIMLLFDHISMTLETVTAGAIITVSSCDDYATVDATKDAVGQPIPVVTKQQLYLFNCMGQ